MEDLLSVLKLEILTARQVSSHIYNYYYLTGFCFVRVIGSLSLVYIINKISVHFYD